MALEELNHYVKDYFGLEHDEIDSITPLFKVRHLEKGDFLLKEGSKRSELSFIRSGFVRIYTQYEAKEVTQWISSPGDFVAELGALIFDQPSRFNIQALGTCELFSLSKENYKNLGTVIPEWNEIEKLFLAKCFMMLEQRVFSFISMSAEERYAMLYDQKRELFNQVPQQHLASMLGMTPETFSRIRAKITS